MRNKIEKWLLITALLSFCAGGAVCAWIMNDNNLLQGVSSQSEIKEREDKRRADLIEAFLLGGALTALFGIGTVWSIRRFTNQRGES